MSGLITRRDRQEERLHQQAAQMAQQTIAVFLKTVEVYFGEVLPMSLIQRVQDGCNEYGREMNAKGEDFTFGKLAAKVEEIVNQYKEEEMAKIEARMAAAQSGSLPIL